MPGQRDPKTVMLDIVNLGSMASWYQMKNARDDQVAIQAFSQLIYGLEAQLYVSAISQAMNFQFLKTRDSVMTVLRRCGIEEGRVQDSLWSDSLYGWSEWKSL